MEWGLVVWLRDHFANKQECKLGLSCSAQDKTETATGDWKHLKVAGIFKHFDSDVPVCAWIYFWFINFVIVIITWSQQSQEQQCTSEPDSSTQTNQKAKLFLQSLGKGMDGATVAKWEGNSAGGKHSTNTHWCRCECALPSSQRCPFMLPSGGGLHLGGPDLPPHFRM